jgi:hypothetical protein
LIVSSGASLSGHAEPGREGRDLRRLLSFLLSVFGLRSYDGGVWLFCEVFFGRAACHSISPTAQSKNPTP